MRARGPAFESCLRFFLASAKIFAAVAQPSLFTHKGSRSVV